MQIETVILFGASLLFSIVCLIDLKHAIEEQNAPAVGAVTGLLSSILWFVFSFLWIAGASDEMFVSIGILWMAFGFIFLVVTFLCVAYILKATVSKSSLQLEIREAPPE